MLPSVLWRQLMPLPLTVSCTSKIQIGFTFLVPAYVSSPRKRAIKRVCVCVCVLETHVASSYQISLSLRSSYFSHIFIFFVNYTYTHLMSLFLGLPREAKPNWILLKQETVSGISWAICKSAPCSRQITTPAPHHSVFYRSGVLPATQPTVSEHWRLCELLRQ